MTRICERQYRCPKCKTVFNGNIVASCGQYGVKWSDLCPCYWGYNPRPYFLARCPECDFCDYTDKFSSGQPTQKLEAPNDPGGTSLERYKRAFDIAQNTKVPLRQLVDYAVQVAWSRHEMNNDNKELREARETVVHYSQKILGDCEVPSEEAIPIHYVIAEFSRQNGDFETAKKHLLLMENAQHWKELVIQFKKHLDAKDINPYQIGTDEESTV